MTPGAEAALQVVFDAFTYGLVAGTAFVALLVTIGKGVK